MFGCYRRSDAADADTYTAAVAMVLAHYSAEVVKVVTDPFAGLPSLKKENGYSGLPDVADVKEACEGEAARVERMAHYAKLGTTQRRLPAPVAKATGSLATIFVHADHRGYAEMVERAKGADPRLWKLDEAGRPGIWVAFNWYDEFRNGGGRPKGFTLYTDEQLRAMYPPRVSEPAAEGAEF